MGLSLEFVIGNADRLVEALQSVDISAIDDPAIVSDRADLSLHLSPDDLDLLSRAIGEHSRQPVKDLHPFLTVLVDLEDGGALSVSPEWVTYVAALEPEQVATVVDTWFTRMRKQHSDPDIQVTADAVTAVAELLSLCKRSQKTALPVIHLWFL